MVYPLGSILVVRSMTGKNKQAFLEGHTSEISCVAMSSDGTRIVSGQVCTCVCLLGRRMSESSVIGIFVDFWCTNRLVRPLCPTTILGCMGEVRESKFCGHGTGNSARPAVGQPPSACASLLVLEGRETVDDPGNKMSYAGHQR